ncbi:methyl-accepting chemotaxis protein [Thermodesulfobacteriota bacterium]
MRIKLSLKNKLLLMTLFMVIVPLATISTISSLSNSRIIQNMREKEMRNNISLITDSFSSTKANLHRTTEIISQDGSLVEKIYYYVDFGGEREPINNRLKPIFEENSMDKLIVTDASGLGLAYNNDTNRYNFKVNPELIGNSLQETDSSVSLKIIDGKLLVVSASPAIYEEKIVGILISTQEVNETFLKKIKGESSLVVGSYYAGKIQAATDSGLKSYQLPETTLQKLKNKEFVIDKLKIDGKEHNISYLPFFSDEQKYLGVFLFGLDNEGIIEMRTKALFGIGIAATIILLIAGIISWLLGRGIANPIANIAEELTSSANEVALGSGEVSASSHQLAEGATQQAASLEETSASLDEMASMTKQNADNAGQAKNLMTETNVVVDRANGSMDELTSAMEDVSRASTETSKIIKTVDEIAFQTNLLALNAAVEAARAGEAGAGFAVVADEVRNLAMRAAKAAQDTAGLIEKTINSAHRGTELVHATRDDFSKVAESTKNSGTLINEIAAASTEQSQGITQINAAVSEMESVTQKTTVNAEESTGIAEEMYNQAKLMKIIVNKLTTVIGGQIATQKSADQEMVFSPEKRETSPGENCWDVRNCPTASKENCNAFPNYGLNCWEIAGTFCGGKLQDDVNKKQSNCIQCDFYQLINKQQSLQIAG